MTPAEASEYMRMSEGALGQLRYTGKGPRFLKPTGKTVLYRKRDLDAWLEASERTSTAGVA
jgi:hypothetical protein